jgi:formylglycine-generating enzyme
MEAAAPEPQGSEAEEGGIAPQTPFELPAPPPRAFVSDSRFPECVHPRVAAACENGWCHIPAGCFIWGSPESEPRRSEAREQQGPVTLTHDFEMQQHEVTIKEWQELDFDLPEIQGFCRESECPVGRISWSHVATFANALSAAHDPPLEPCYVLEGCRMFHGNLACGCIPTDSVTEPMDRSGSLGMNEETVYECEGYRLPTRAEWQYAARAGTTTAFYSGPITVTAEQESNAESCLDLQERALDPVAWYCVNSGGVSHPVGGKLPNAWGFYDMLGNLGEFTHDPDPGRAPVYPASDPFGEIGILQDGRMAVGGSAIGWPSLLRIASGLQEGSDSGTALVGFRLARTLGPGSVPTVADVSVTE